MIDPQMLSLLETILKCITALLGLAGAVAAFKKAKIEETATPVKPLFGSYGIAVVCGVVALFAFALLVFRPTSGAALSRFLSKFDPGVFSGSADGQYRIARVLANRSDLDSNTKLAETIKSTSATFDLLVIGGGVFQHYQETFQDAIERGVHVRILIQDPGPATKGFYDTIFGSARDNFPDGQRAQAAATSQAVKNLQNRIESNRDRFKGNLEIRWLQKPLLFSMWLKDSADKNNAVANLTVFSYRSSTWDPCFRVGRDAFELVNGLREEFDMLWNSSPTNASQ